VETPSVGIGNIGEINFSRSQRAVKNLPFIIFSHRCPIQSHVVSSHRILICRALHIHKTVTLQYIYLFPPSVLHVHSSKCPLAYFATRLETNPANLTKQSVTQ
jgi:hypothetical protein